ncbi:hypothetical protein INT43_004710 [Umbelopsis isabellina]|uniref:Uncharacterized protein n=1 Tax=Mortierella isabellina TaxID=91625 RepID=A0A8H7PG47_MORIS|nr:hypothetical protein INT43_004710 [Umbelopsis isabellina]
MDFDDEAFADNFDEDLLRAVEQQESQYFGVAGPSVVQNFASAAHSNGENEVERLRRMLAEKEQQISQQKIRLEQLTTNIEYENQHKLSMERQIAYKDRLIASRDGEILSARQQIRMLDNRNRSQSRQSVPPPQISDPTDYGYREPSATPSMSEHMEGDESSSRKRSQRALPKSMFTAPKTKKQRLLPRSITPDVDVVNQQMQETHVTSPTVDKGKDMLLRRLLCEVVQGDDTLNTAREFDIRNTAQITQLSEDYAKRFAPLADGNSDPKLQDISLTLFECLVQAPNVSINWTTRQLTTIFSQYIVISRRHRMIEVLQPAIHALNILVASYDVPKEHLLRAQLQDKENAALHNLILAISFFPSPDFEVQYERAHEKREAIANLKFEKFVNLDAYVNSYGLTLDDLEYNNDKKKMLSHRSLLEITSIMHHVLSSSANGQSECWYFLRDKSFISLLHMARPIPIIQQALQVILDQVNACCIPHHLIAVKTTPNNERRKDDLAVLEQLSNNGDNFRSILDNMVELMKYSCKDEMQATEWDSIRLTIINIVDVALAANSLSILSEEVSLVLAMVERYLTLEVDKIKGKKATKLSLKSKVTVSICITIVHRLFQLNPTEISHMDSVLEDNLKKAMRELQLVKQQWDIGDAELIDVIIDLMDNHVDIKMEIATVS